MPTSPFNNGAPPAGAFFAGAPSTVADYLKSRSLLANSHANAKRDVNRSGLSPAQRNAKLQREIAQAGGVPNRQPHGPKTKGSPDQFYAGVADAAGAVANLTGDIADLTLGAPVNAIGSVVDPGAPRLQFNTEPYYGYDQPVGFGAQIRDLPHALATAGADLYNHPIGTFLEQGQYFDPNSFVVPDASSPLPGRSEGAPSVPRDLAPAGEEGAAATGVTGSQLGIMPRRAGKVPVREHEVTTYKDFNDRSVPGDGIAGHEVWQHANQKAHGLAHKRLSTPASRDNPVLVLRKAKHTPVTAAQGGFDAANQTPIENINANAAILRNQKAAPEDAIAKAHRMAIEHANKHGYDK